VGLSCSCGGDYDWYYNAPEDFIKFKPKRRKRCCSCGELINIGSDCLEFDRYKISEYGDEIYLASKFMCEKCGEIFLNLSDLGYCLTIGIYSMQECLEEYWELTGFEPKQST